MTATLLDNPRRATAGAFETLLIITVGAGFAVLPVLFLRHPRQVAPLEWFVAAPGIAVALVAGFLGLWRILGQETLTLQDGALHLVWRLGPLHRSWAVPVSQVTEVRLQPYGTPEQQNTIMGFGHTGLLVCYDSNRSLRCGVALGGHLAEATAERIRAAVLEGRAVEHPDAPDEVRAGNRTRGPRR